MSTHRKPRRTFLDWNDKAAVRRFLVDAHVQAEDIDGVMQDMLLPPRERELGPALAREKYGDAMRSLLFLLDFAIGPEGFAPPDDEHGDPAGNGGAGPTH
jgi:hypothetical protein